MNEPEEIIKRILRLYLYIKNINWHVSLDGIWADNGQALYYSKDDPILSVVVEIHQLHLLLGIDEIKLYNIQFR